MNPLLPPLPRGERQARTFSRNSRGKKKRRSEDAIKRVTLAHTTLSDRTDLPAAGELLSRGDLFRAHPSLLSPFLSVALSMIEETSLSLCLSLSYTRLSVVR